MNKSIMGGAVLAGIASLAASGSALAQDESDIQCGQRDTYVYFGNGVWVQPGREMRTNLRALEDLVEAGLESRYPDETFLFREAYNPTEGRLRDIQEVYRQRALDGGLTPLTTEQIGALLKLRAEDLEKLRNDVATLEDTTSGFESIVNLFVDDDPLEVAREVVAAFEEVIDDLELDQDLSLTNDRLTQLYRGNLDAGERVVIVPHSQGNLFALTSIETLIAEEPANAASIGAIGIATPADRTPNGGDYTTANDDVVINGLRGNFAVLPGNIDNDLGTGNDDPRDAFDFNHTFISGYLRPPVPSRNVIAQNVYTLVSNLQFPEVEAGEGALRATLTWGSEPDVDLHAFEPNGAQVFYADSNGPSGNLDVDDVTSFGPENYFVGCETIELGRYSIGVNYYRGSGPETATVQLSLEDGQVFTSSVQLPSARGSAGNSSPRIVFTIDVSLEPETLAYRYEVVSN